MEWLSPEHVYDDSLEVQQPKEFFIFGGVATGKHSSMHETKGPNKSHKIRQQTPPL